MSQVDRFLSKVDRSGDCWIWMSYRNKYGYGSTSFGAKKWVTHRVSYVLFRGEIPDGMLVLHKCDNPSCVNPDHLFLGTHQENMDDMVRKGRSNSPAGEIHRSAKLTNSQVAEIRIRYRRGNGASLCREFGLSHNAVSDIIRGKTWRAA